MCVCALVSPLWSSVLVDKPRRGQGSWGVCVVFVFAQNAFCMQLFLDTINRTDVRMIRLQ